MVIKENEINNVPFRSLKSGEVFRFNSVLYMTIGDDVTTLSAIDKDGGIEYWTNAVRLSSGKVANFSSDTIVEKVDAELVVK